jgi:hypothetical protein
MIYNLPPKVSEIATKYRLRPEHVEQASQTSKLVYERREIGGTTLVVDSNDVMAFVKEVRALRGKPMWKR